MSSLDDEDFSDTELVSSIQSDNYNKYNLKINKKTYLPINGDEILKNKFNFYLKRFKHDTESVVKIDDLIISTICYKPIGNKWKYAGNKGWKPVWLVINTYEKYFKLFIYKNNLYRELELKNGNDKYFKKCDLTKFKSTSRIEPSHSLFKFSVIENNQKNIMKYEKKNNKKLENFDINIKSRRIMKLGSIHLNKLECIRKIIYNVINPNIVYI